MECKSFEGKVVIVTGSSCGIGESAAIEFAKKGALLTIHGRREDRLQQVADQIKQVSANETIIVIGDIDDEKVRNALLDKTIAKHGKLDILISNAGYMTHGGWQSSIVDMRAMLENHVVSPFHLSQLCMPYLIETKGNIVFTSSVAAFRGSPMAVAYSTAKAALDNMMRGLAVEVAELGVRINCVNPGPVKTEFIRDPALLKYLLEREADKMAVAMKRLSQPEDVANMILFLASDQARMITGTTHNVDRGFTAALQP